MSVKYHFTVHTTDQQGAGTDANIFIRMTGERGVSNEVRLNPFIKGNAFERNKTDKFMAEFLEDVGDIYEIQLRSDMKYLAAPWMVDYVQIAFVLDSKKSKFRSTSTFQIAKRIADKDAHVFAVTSGFSSRIDPKPAIWEEQRENPVLVPAGSTYKRTVTNEWILEYEASKASIRSASLSTDVSGKWGAISAAFSAKIDSQIEARQSAKIGQRQVTESECHLAPVDHPRRLQEVWAQKVEPMTITLGDTLIEDMPLRSEKRFCGLIDADTMTWAYADRAVLGLVSPAAVA